MFRENALSSPRNNSSSYYFLVLRRPAASVPRRPTILSDSLSFVLWFGYRHSPARCYCSRIVHFQHLCDSQEGLNGPTVVHQGLSSAAFQMLAADPHAIMSIGGGNPLYLTLEPLLELCTTRRISTNLSLFQREICALEAWHKD